MNEILEITTNTPIEIALGVDKEGMTTAKKLFEFLGMSKNNYSRWIKNNITENQFAEENIDYFPFLTKEEREFNPNPTQDYKLTSKFARKLSMLQKSERGEQAREYFASLEDKVKQKAIDRAQLSPAMQITLSLAENLAQQELEQKRQAEQLKQLEDKTQKQSKAIQTVRETLIQSGNMVATETWISKCINKIAENPNFTYQFGNCYAAAKNESYKRLTDKAGCRLDQKLRNAIERAEEKGYTKAQIKNINKLSVIMADKRLKEIYIGVIKEMMIAYCIEIV